VALTVPTQRAVIPPPPKISAVHRSLTAILPKWDKLNDCLEGQDAIKAAGEKYLPIPRVDDDPEQNRIRYNNYLMRAVWYNATSRTLQGLVGEVYSRDPVMTIPDELSVFKTDIDGAGVNVNQQSKACLSYVLAYGRAGLLIDYPKTDGPITIAQQKSGEIRPTVTLYRGDEVINWRTRKVGAKRLLSLVVIHESYEHAPNPFEVSTGHQWRVLQLNDANEYFVQVWRRRERLDTDPLYDGLDTDWFDYIYEETVPTDAAGQPFKSIPFTFVGVMNNDENPDTPPMYDLACLNIAHYRNSADYEESAFMVGQPTAWFSGLTQSWVDDVFQGRIFLGSRAAIPLPVGAQAGLLQVNANSMPKEAMDQKERQMVALGAKLVVNNDVQRTLGEAQQEEASESSILATATKNVSIAYTFAIQVASQFVVTGGIAIEKILYDLNTDFPAARLTPNDRAQLISEWQSGAITFNEMRDALRRGGIATADNDDAKADIEANPSPNMKQTQVDNELASKAFDMKKTAPNNAPSGGNQAGQ
jgi:hypothetical protein